MEWANQFQNLNVTLNVYSENQSLPRNAFLERNVHHAYFCLGSKSPAALSWLNSVEHKEN